MTIETWLTEATNVLKADNISSAKLDAELILSHTLRKQHTYLHAHGDQELDARHKDIADARIQLRLDHTPVAYIVGHKEFYGHRFKTTPTALIPRPESEVIIELLTDIIPKNSSLIPTTLRLIDVGTGTGCLGISAKLEWPELDVTLIDISRHALNLAKENAELLHAEVNLVKADLLHGFVDNVDIIIANLPYVDKSWDVSPDTYTEPDQALYAPDGGLALIKQLITQSTLVLPHGGHLLLESDIRQQEAIIAFAKDNGFKLEIVKDLITQFIKN
ncbi:MAG: peptide chain release factor N(5)-glutamine methyltransferase [Candidatus Saccharimonadales bacterium]